MPKNLLCLFLTFKTLLVVASAQDVITKFSAYANTPETIEVKAGEVCDILSMAGVIVISSQADISTSPNTAALSSPYNSYAPTHPFPIAGPCWIIVGSQGGGSGAISYRIRTNTSSSTTIPTSAVVIPTDATGPVNIILESSTDLVTWTAATPGTYGASTTKRFFRVRAVNQ